jgi:hypothetical protein
MYQHYIRYRYGLYLDSVTLGLWSLLLTLLVTKLQKVSLTLINNDKGEYQSLTEESTCTSFNIHLAPMPK